MVRVLTGAIALCSLFAGLLLPRCAEAAIIVYTDRATWESAVGALTTENFNSFANLTPVTPATIFPSGIVVNGTDTDISSFAFSDIGQGNALRAFETFTVTMPGSVVAFGFDYADHDGAFGTLQIVINGVPYDLPTTGDADFAVSPDDFGFFGVIAGSPAEIPGSQFTVQNSSTFNGLVYDNLSFTSSLTVVPEPASLALMALGLVAAGAGFRKARVRRAA